MEEARQWGISAVGGCVAPWSGTCLDEEGKLGLWWKPREGGGRSQCAMVVLVGSSEEEQAKDFRTWGLPWEEIEMEVVTTMGLFGCRNWP